MNPPARQHASPVQQLLDDPHRFGFFQAVRLLERWLQQSEGLPAHQVLSQRLAFRNSLSLAFPASEIAVLELQGRELADAEPADPQPTTGPASDAPPVADGRPDSRGIGRIEITPAFFSLLGVGGALPMHYTELLAEQEQQRRGPDRTAPRAFYDIFLHRATVLFYQAWRKHRLPVQFEADRRNRFLPLMLSVAGLGHPGLRDRLQAGEGGVSDDALAFYASSLQRRPVSASTMQRVLQHYFNVPVKLHSFVGRWFTLPESNRSHLGLSNVQLGSDTVLGARVWQRDLRIRLEFGPLTREKYQRFLPGGQAALALKELLAMLTGTTLEYEVRLGLRAADIKGCRLGDTAPRLGHDSFLITRASQVDRHDAGYDLLAVG